MAKEKGAYMLLTNCPSYILSLKKGLELMQESGEPVEFRIFDFYKVFPRAFGEEGNGAAGTWMEAGGCPPILATPGMEVRGIHALRVVIHIRSRWLPQTLLQIL